MSPPVPRPSSRYAGTGPARSRTSADATTQAPLPVMSEATQRRLLAASRGWVARQKLQCDRRRAARASRQAESAELILARGLEESFARIRETQGRTDRDLSHERRLR